MQGADADDADPSAPTIGLVVAKLDEETAGSNGKLLVVGDAPLPDDARAARLSGRRLRRTCAARRDRSRASRTMPSVNSTSEPSPPSRAWWPIVIALGVLGVIAALAMGLVLLRMAADATRGPVPFAGAPRH